ncbi:MAG TPA: hypothetical protein O0X50_01250, partial [Methanocorpusculum sp.]|nr:hypothetical protein [Methanocorpusculum sp.]
MWDTSVIRSGGYCAVGFGDAENRISVKHVDLQQLAVFFHCWAELVFPAGRVYGDLPNPYG